MLVSTLFAQIVTIVLGLGAILTFLKVIFKPIKMQTTQIQANNKLSNKNADAIQKIQCSLDDHAQKLDKDFKVLTNLKEENVDINKQIVDLKIDIDKRIMNDNEAIKLLLEDRLVRDDDELGKKQMQEKIQQFLLKNV